MLKIKIAENFRHRNETTFRPYLNAAHLFREVGIEFVFEGNGYDLTWVGQASISDKNHPLKRANRRGKWFIDNEVEGDFIIFDGQDSPSLIGVYEVLKSTEAKLLLKNSLYKDRSDYERPSIHGRTYWGSSADYAGKSYRNESIIGDSKVKVHEASEYDYSITKPDFSKIKLSGTNWLGTVNPYWFDVRSMKKDYDVFAMFQYPAKYNDEFCRPTHQFYDAHRQRCMNWIDMLPASVKVAKLDAGKKVPIEQYYDMMKRSKIVVAPFGYGEMAPRDIESAMVGAVLIKPDMGHVESIPNVYEPEVTYRSVKWDFSNLNDVILDTLDGFDGDAMIENLRYSYVRQYSAENLVTYMHSIISNLSGYGTV